MLRSGEAVMDERPVFVRDERAAVVHLLESAHAEHRLDVAGPLLDFEPESALGAAEFVSNACWFLVANAAPDVVEKGLVWPRNPGSAEEHLSADICLRFLATVYRRARIRPPEDALHRAVVDVLCRWPLSGAATEVAAPPLGDLEFHHHFGLQLLYAERLAANRRPAWVPAAGRTREAVELVLHQQGKRLEPAAEGGTE